MSDAGIPKEPSAALTRKRKRNLMLIAATLIVVAVVIAALLIPPPPPEKEPKLTVKFQPDAVSLPAGRTVALGFSLEYEGAADDLYSWDYEWDVNPYWLGDLDLQQPSWGAPITKPTDYPEVNFTAGAHAISGNVTLTVTYGELVATAIADITVGPPVLDNATITPHDTQVLVNRSTTFEVIARNSLGATDFNFSADWSVEGLDSSDYELNRTTGRSLKFLSKTPANVTLIALVHYGNDTLTCNASVEAISEPPRTVSYRWYDMFNVPFREWFEIRWDTYHTDERTSDSYPYIFRSYTSWPSYVNYYSNMRLNITARSLTEISMNERPEFLPFLGAERGGNTIINWYMQYLTSDEIHVRYPTLAGVNDGWLVVLNGTVTLDRQAAFAVLGLTEDDLVDFSSWWNASSRSVMTNFTSWLIEEAGPSRLDIWPMYEWPLTLHHLLLDAEKVGDQIVLSYDIVSWGMEALMTRWLHEAFLPTEWWFEDMRFNARIGPSLTDIDIDAVVKYAVKASNSTQTGQPCWIWEAMLQYMVPYDTHPRPMIQSPYFDVNWRYMDMGEWVLPPDPLPGGLPITYTPGSFNLTTGEELRFEWPSGDVNFMTYPFLRNWTNTSAGITLGYSEPNQTDMPVGQYVFNMTDRYLEFVGPFDFWTWSKDQTEHAYLLDKWQLFDLLPYGMPYLEFWPL